MIVIKIFALLLVTQFIERIESQHSLLFNKNKTSLTIFTTSATNKLAFVRHLFDELSAIVGTTSDESVDVRFLWFALDHCESWSNPIGSPFTMGHNLTSSQFISASKFIQVCMPTHMKQVHVGTLNEYLFALGEEEAISAFLPHAFKYIFNDSKAEAISSNTYPLVIYLHHRVWIKDILPSPSSNCVISLLSAMRDYMTKSAVVINEHGKRMIRSTYSIQQVVVPVVSTVHIQLMGMNLNVHLGSHSLGDGSEGSYLESTSAWLDRWAQSSWLCDVHFQLRITGKSSRRGGGITIYAINASNFC
jgi:hypothetical protein